MTRRLKVCLTALAFGLLAGAAPPETAAPLSIYFIDVDGGAATLIVTPERESVLIDSGWPGLDDRDPKRIAHVLRDLEKLERLDHLVTTHWHTDHFGGVAGLARLLPIGHYWDRGLPANDGSPEDAAGFPDGPRADDPLGVAYRHASEGKRQTLRAGDTLPLRGATRALVLASGGTVLTGPSGASVNPACASAPPPQPVDPSDNAKSLALRFRLGAFDYLNCGDLTWNVEQLLVCPIDRVGPIDLLQVTHHGSGSSSHPTLLATAAPTVGVIVNGPKKGGDAETFRRLKAVPSLRAVYQLHRNAATGPEDQTAPELIANPDPAGGKFIKVTVPADGSRFTVSIGPDGPGRAFESR